MKYAAVLGNMSDGYSHYGPFDTYEEADVWATSHEGGEGWDVVTLGVPNVSS
jgi:hypothetical protein